MTDEQERAARAMLAALKEISATEPGGMSIIANTAIAQAEAAGIKAGKPKLKKPKPAS